MTKQPLNQKHCFFFFKAKIDLDCIAKRHVRFSPFPSFHNSQLTLEGRMKLNCSSCLFFGCECFGTCTCVCKLLILLCCQINVFKSFRAKRGRGHFPLPDPPPFGDPHPLWVHIFFFEPPLFLTWLRACIVCTSRIRRCRDNNALNH